MSAQECNNPWLHEYAHILRREGRTHAKPQKVLMLAGHVIRSQPEDGQPASERLAAAVTI